MLRPTWSSWGRLSLGLLRSRWLPSCSSPRHRGPGPAAAGALFLLALPVLGLGLALTFVRGAWLGVAVRLAYLGFTRHRVLLLGLPLVTLCLLFLPSEVSTAVLGGSSGADRVSSWQESVDRILTKPLGGGIGARARSTNRTIAT